jgi:hypothetical protein
MYAIKKYTSKVQAHLAEENWKPCEKFRWSFRLRKPDISLCVYKYESRQQDAPSIPCCTLQKLTAIHFVRVNAETYFAWNENQFAWNKKKTNLQQKSICLFHFIIIT